MAYINVEVDIDIEDHLDSVKTRHLIEELITRNGWQQELDKAITGKSFDVELPASITGIREICELARYGKPYEGKLAEYAFNEFGFVM